MILNKHNNGRKNKAAWTSKFAVFLLVAVISSQNMITAFAANGVPESAIEPNAASYGYYVDVYSNNSTSNMTPETNPSIGVLSGFLKIWTPGTTWNDGTIIDNAVHNANIAKTVSITSSRTAEEEDQAYLDDRRNQSYGVINGLGPYTENFVTGANAGTSIPDTIPADADTVLYNDSGNSNGKWADEDSSLGNIVKLVNTVRNSSASTTPAKAYYNYMRPFRWSTDVSVISNLTPAIKSDPTSDGGFPSGHTNAGYLTALSIAYAVPERFQEMVTRASELGDNRIVVGMHSPLDVIGGRIMSTAIVASVLNDSNNAQLKQEAYAQSQEVLLAQTGTSEDKYGDYESNKKNYTERLTYGFEQTGDTTKPMVVPKGAEALLETRLPYLDATQRRWVLYSTGLTSGYPVLDDAEGWGRLNLFAAANGYGAFDNDVTVTMDASKGGYNASDNWKNDIGGTGTLTKLGSGKLILSGDNSYSGGTVLNEGTLEATSSTAFGNGGVENNGGTITENSDSLTINGDFIQSKDGILELNIGNKDDLLKIAGNASFGGTLKLNFIGGYIPDSDSSIITYSSLTEGSSFSSIEITGLPESYDAKIVNGATGLSIVSGAGVIDSPDETDDSKSKIVNAVKTGDVNNVLIYILLISGSFAICSVVVFKRRKEEF